MKKIIIIPCYNEFENINIILDKIQECKINDLTVVIVQDSEINFKKKIKFYEFNAIYLHRKKKSGRGSAVIFGIKYVLKKFKNIEIIIEMDADMSHNPKELNNNIEYFKTQNLDLLISSRYMRTSKILNWSLKRKILSFLSNKLSKFLLKVPVSDYTNGYRIYSLQAAKFISINCGKIGDGYIVLSEILMQLHYSKFKIGEVNTIFLNRKRGKSNVSLKEIIASLIGLYKIWKIKKNFK
jgi:dolichol-phosphate mannosyltransferase